MSSSRPPIPEHRPPDEPPFSREPDLRADLTALHRPAVLTGGQTGVDTGAAIAALNAGLAVHLVFPRGFRQEDGPITPSRRRAVRGATLHELASPEFSYRTWTCVHLTDAVVLIDPVGGDGCQETIRAASHLGRPLLNLAAGAEFFQPESNAQGLAVSSDFSAWLTAYRPRVLMIAGCRASLLTNNRPDLDLSGQLEAIVAEFGARDVGPGNRADGLLVVGRSAPVDVNGVGYVRVPLEPVAGERAHWHQGEPFLSRPIDGGSDELPADAVPGQLLRNSGVNEDEPVSTPAVDKLRDGSVDGHFEPGLVAVVNHARGVAHASMVASQSPTASFGRHDSG